MRQKNKSAARSHYSQPELLAHDRDELRHVIEMDPGNARYHSVLGYS